MFNVQVISRQYLSPGDTFQIGYWSVFQSVLIYLGAPLVAGVLTRIIVIRLASQEWFEKKFMAYFGPLALVALVYTIIIIFAVRGSQLLLVGMTLPAVLLGMGCVGVSSRVRM